MIQVKHPSGEIIGFQDGTSDDEIAKAMRAIDAEIAASTPKEAPKVESPIQTSPSPELGKQISDLQKGIINIPKDSVEKYPGEKIDKASNPDVGEAVLPRFAKKSGDRNSTVLQRLNAVKSDVLSLPGRTIASGVDAATGGPSMGQGMQDTQGKTTLGKIVRSPATGAAIAVAPFTGGASLGAIATGIGASAIAGATEQQAENLNQDKKFSGKEFGKDLALGVAGGVVGAGAGKVLGAIGGKIVSKFGAEGKIAAGAEKLIADLKPTGNMIAQGFKKEKLIEHGIVGTPTESLSRAKGLIADASNNIKAEIENLTSKGMKEPTVDVGQVISDVSKSEHITPEFAAEQKAVLDDLFYRLENRDPSGQIKISEIPKIKQAITELRNDFNKPPSSMGDAILGKTYHALDDAFYKTLDNLPLDAAKIRASNKAMSELIPIASVLEKKVAQGVEEKIPGLASKLAKGAGSSALPELAAAHLGVPPGLITAAKTMGTIADHANASGALKAVSNQQIKAYQEILKVTKGNIPLPEAIENKIMNNTAFTESEIATIENWVEASIRSNSIGGKVSAILSKGSKKVAEKATPKNFGQIGTAIGIQADK